MPSKKKKYNARFPPARIKKIMQTDEDVGKVAAAVPVIISRSLELFIQSFMHKTAAITKGRNAKTLSAAHIKQTIHSEKTFDFLRDLVSNVPDHQPDEEGDSNASVPSGSSGPEVKKQKIQKPKKEKTGNGRGRPRKKSVVVEEKQETESEHDDDGDDEETESDSSQTNTEQLEKPTDSSVPHPFNMQAPPQSGPYSAESLSNSTSHMNPAFTSPPSLANLMPPSRPQQNPSSPRLPILQSPPELSNFPMMPPHPQLQNMPNQIPSPQQHFSGVTNQIPPYMFTNFSNQLPVRPNFYPTHSLNLQQYPNMNSQETFPNDQKLFTTSPVAPPFPHSQSHPQFKHETNPARSVMNSMQNNEPLDMSKASLIQRSPVISQEVDPGKNKELPISLTGLSNIMNRTSSKPLTDDDDYDT